MSEAKAKSRAKSPRRDVPRERAEIPANVEALMDRRDVAAALRVSTQTLGRMVAAGEYPAAEFQMRGRSGHSPRWSRATHDAWVRSRCGRAETGGA